MVRYGDGRIAVRGSIQAIVVSAFLLSTVVLLAFLTIQTTGTGPDEAGEPPVAQAGDDLVGVLINDTVMLNGTGSTDEEIGLCTWVWESTSHPDIQVSPKNSSTPKFTVTVEETITFLLTLTDPSGQFSTDTVDVMVDINEPPRITIASPAPSGSEGPFYQRSTPIEFTANGTYDPEGRDDQLEYEWTSNVSGQLSNRRYFTTVLTDLGWHRIALEVRDRNGGVARDTMDIKVREDPLPPVARIDVKPMRPDLRYGKAEPITLDASRTTDGNSFDTHDTMNFTWRTDNPTDVVLGYGTVITVSLVEGAHNITLDVVDTDGLTGQEWVHLFSFNSPPEAMIKTVGIKLRNSLPTLNISEAGQFTAAFSSDPDGDVLQYQWDLGDGATTVGETATHSWSTYGNYNIALTVDDRSEENNTDQVTFPISINSIPVAVADQEILVEVGSSFTITANGSYDEDGDPLSYMWDLDGDGGYDSSRFDPTWKFSTEGDHEVRLRVSDGFAFSETTSVVSAIYPNGPPVASILNDLINGEVLVPLSDGRGEVELDATPSIDPDDDTDGNGEINGREENNLTYSWDLDPGEDSDDDGISDNDVDATGKKVKVKVTQSGLSTVILKATDPRGLFGTLEIKLRGNHPPDSLSIRVGPAIKVLTRAQVTFTGSADDDDRADRNKLEYYWDFGDGEKTTSSNFQGKHTYLKKGTYEVELRVSDGLMGTTTRTSIMVVDMETPTVSYPANGSEVSGSISLSGRIRDVKGFEVDKVEVKEGAKDWKLADGTIQWNYLLDTTQHKNGDLDIRIRYTVYDVEDIQTETLISVKVVNTTEGGMDWTLIAIGFVVLVVIMIVLYLLFRRKPRNWDDLLPPPSSPPGPRMPPMVAPGGLPPARVGELPAVQPPKVSNAPSQASPPTDQVQKPKTIRIKCPACSKVFKVTDTGDRPLHMTCKHCGAAGTVDHVPGGDEEQKEQAPPEKAGEEEELIEPVPIVCPSCKNLFELDQVTETAKCPFCGAEGELDESTIALLEEKFGGREEHTLRCPSCAGTFKVKSGDATIICPYCGAKGRASA
ncbi:MAG: PKD domain-containing protein [Candidatus Thermoplasmatota archaeon]|nr:PKD domain-containing protein [Candidatus Thermoplasmatota archaeon]